MLIPSACTVWEPLTKPDTSRWRDSRTYDHFDGLSVEGLAWECLRRDPSYRQAYHGLIETGNAAASLPADIPKAARPESQRANLDALVVRLDDEDRAAIAALPRDQRFVRPLFAPDWDAAA